MGQIKEIKKENELLSVVETDTENPKYKKVRPISAGEILDALIKKGVLNDSDVTPL